MSTPDIVKGTYVSILVEDPDSAGTYLTLCGLTTRSLTHQVNTRDRFTRDCADPEAIPVRRLVTTGQQWDLSGSGLYNRAQASLIAGLIGVVANYRFLIGEPAADAIYSSYHGGAAMLTQRQITGSDEDDVQAELTFASDGEWTETEV